MAQLTAVEYLLAGISSFLIVAILTPIFRRVAIRINFVDTPIAQHKTHKSPVPYMGGVAIMLGVIIVMFLAVHLRADQGQVDLALSIFIPAAVLGIVGLVDDKYSLPPFSRFIVQTAMGLITASIVISSNSSGNPTGAVFLDAAISTIWVVGISNSINFFDNVDGGASGTVAVIAIGIFVIAFFNGQFLLAAVSIVIVGATTSFLFWNKAPARIYMGDAGALFLGFILAVLTIRLNPDVESKILSFAVPLLLLAVPILDTSVAVLSRIRRGVSPFQGGHDHLSHRLMRRGLTKKSAVLSLWALSGVFVGLSALIASSDLQNAFLAISGILFWLFLLMAFMRIPDSDMQKA